MRRLCHRTCRLISEVLIVHQQPYVSDHFDTIAISRSASTTPVWRVPSRGVDTGVHSLAMATSLRL